MNIFYLHNDPAICALYHCDKHVVKMIVEYCQLLSTAHRMLDGNPLPNTELDKILYKNTHYNHPSAIWARMCRENYQWLHALLVELNREYTRRYGRVHKSASGGVIDALATTPQNLPEGSFTEPTQAMPDEYKVPGDSISAYKKFYVAEKSSFAKWKGKLEESFEPKWYSDHSKNLETL